MATDRDKDHLHSSAFYPSVPPISLELTSKCNLKCPYCANSQLSRPAAFIDWDLFEKIVENCAQGGHNIAALHGTGEPLMWPRLEEAISLIRAKNAGEASFATNGVLLRPARVKSLLAAGLTSLRVSLDSLDPQIYAATRGAKVQKVIKNIQSLIKTAPADFEIIVVLMRHKQQAINSEQVADFYKTFGFHENVTLEIVDNGLMVDSPEDFRERPIKTSRCSRSREWFTITSEGLVSLCCSDQNALKVLGDLRRQTIEEIWYAPQSQEMFANIALGRGPCPEVCTRHCWLEEPSPKETTPVDRSYEVSFNHAIAELEDSLSGGQTARASEILTALESRDPLNDKLSYYATVLSLLSSRQTGVHPGDRLRELQRLQKDLAEKDKLIHKHHDFAQKLLAELADRDVTVATKWEDVG